MEMALPQPYKVVTKKEVIIFAQAVAYIYTKTDDIAYCYQQKTRSLAEKQNLVIQGKFGKINSLKNDITL